MSNDKVDVPISGSVRELHDPNWVSRFVCKRYGITMIVLLLAWPLFGFRSKLESLVVNGLLLDSYVQLGFVAFVNTLAFFFAVAIQRLLNRRIPGKYWSNLFGDGSQPWATFGILLTLGAVAISPIVLAFGFGSEFPFNGLDHTWRVFLAIFTGEAIGVFALFLAGFGKCWFIGSEANTQNFFPFEARDKPKPKLIVWVATALAKVWQTPPFKWSKVVFHWLTKVLRLERIDGQFLGYLFVLACFHWGTARWLNESETWLTSAPAMVILLIWISCMAMAGFANALDRFRLPVVAIVLLVLTAWLSLFGSTRDIRTVDDDSDNRFVNIVSAVGQKERDFLDSSGNAGGPEHVELITKQTAELEDVAWEAIEKRMSELPKNDEKGKTIVVVTCPGGGIHAAAWSACVMDGLCNEYLEFKGSIGVVSSVSGGSVGTLMFVSTRYEAELKGELMMGAAMPSNEEIHDSLKQTSPGLELAARSSLEHIAYGITTDDLYGSILPWLSRSGRGQRLEDSFSMRLPKEHQDLTMGSWGDRAIDGKVPIVIFNSTDAVSGRRVLFDTIPTPRRASSVGKTSRPLNYRELLAVDTDNPSVDVKPATAARTSATFPYVSPFTKPDRASLLGNSVAICDGGYVDNEGIVTAVNWIEFMEKRWSALPPSERPFNRILLIRIEPAPTADFGKVPDAGGFFGLLRWVFGPAETMVKVRSASQLERGNLESDLAVIYPELNTGETSQEQRIETVKQRSKMLLGSKQQVSDLQMKVQGTLDPAPDSEDVNQSDRSGRLPIFVETIRFQNEDRVIPLNWKLSKKQKRWYIDSWHASESTLRSTLGRFFTPIE